MEVALIHLNFVQGSVVTIVHNNLSYDVLGIQKGIGLDDIMPDMKGRLPSKAAPAGVAGKEGEVAEEQTFRQYFK